MKNKISMWDFAKLGGAEENLINDLAGMWAEKPNEFEVFCNSVKDFKDQFLKVEDGYVEPGFENLCSAVQQTIRGAIWQRHCEKTGEEFGQFVGETINRFSKK